MHLSYLGPVSYVFLIMGSLGAHHREWSRDFSRMNSRGRHRTTIEKEQADGVCAFVCNGAYFGKSELSAGGFIVSAMVKGDFIC